MELLAPAKKPPNKSQLTKESSLRSRQCANVPSSASLLPLHGRVEKNAPLVPLMHRLRRSLHPMYRRSRAGFRPAAILATPTPPDQRHAANQVLQWLALMVWLTGAALSRSAYHVYRCMREFRSLEETSVLSISPSPKHPDPQSAAKRVVSPLIGEFVYVDS